MSSYFGLGPNGFKPMMMSDITSAMQTAFRQQLGTNVRLAPSSYYGQLISIFSEREALLWQLIEAVRLGTTVGGASGLDVDNILSLSNLTRLPARASVTDPSPAVQTNGIPLYGLVLYGTPGTVVPGGSLISDGAAVPNQYSLDKAVTIAAPQNGKQTLYFGNTPTSGSYALTLASPAGDVMTTPLIAYNASPTTVTLLRDPNSTGTQIDPMFSLTIGSQTTAPINFLASPSVVQAAINALPGLANVTVVGTLQSAQISFANASVPTVVFNNVNSTGGIISRNPQAIVPSVQSAINNLTPANSSIQPFSDVTVSTVANGLTFLFGSATPASGMPSSGSAAIAAMTIASSSLAAGGSATSLTVAQNVVGAPAQGVGSATCTVNGPNADVAGSLTSIGTPISGWTGVTNQLDVLPGADIESDADAIKRLRQLKNSTGAASLSSILARVQAVDGVTSAISFVNSADAAQQVLSFSSAPTSGTYSVSLAGQATANIPYSATAAQLQAALRLLPGFSQILVTGSLVGGFGLDFSGVQGGQKQPLAAIASDTTAAGLSARYGRPAHSIELVVTGGEDLAVAQALLASVAAGIGTYGAPIAVTTGNIAANSAALTVASTANIAVGQAVSMRVLPVGTVVTAISQSIVTLSSPANGAASNEMVVFDRRQRIADASGNLQTINFSRPTTRLVFVTIALTTDRYTVPGDATSGTSPNSMFDPSELTTIQNDVMAAVNGLPPGATISARGTNGLEGSFRDQKGIVNYTLSFDVAPNPTNKADITLGASEAPLLSAANVQISFT